MCSVTTGAHSHACNAYSHGEPAHLQTKKGKNTYVSDITPDPGGHRPQRPCATDTAMTRLSWHDSHAQLQDEGIELT